jgi:hypothetical protein
MILEISPCHIKRSWKTVCRLWQSQKFCSHKITSLLRISHQRLGVRQPLPLLHHLSCVEELQGAAALQNLPELFGHAYKLFTVLLNPLQGFN